MSEQKQEVLSHELLAAIGDYGHAKYRHDNDIITLCAWEDLITAIKVWSRLALSAKDARIAELEAERDAWVERATSLQEKLDVAATPSEDGREVPDVVGWRVYNPRTKKTRFYGASKGYLMEGFQNFGYQTEAVTTVAQHSRIVAAKDAEIAMLKEQLAQGGDLIVEFMEEIDQLRAKVCVQMASEPVAYTTQGMLNIAKELPITGRIGAKVKSDERWNVPLYTSAPKVSSPDGAERIAFVLRQIGSMDADDVTGDDVDLRFEDADGRETGCDVSIVEYAEKAADLIEAMIAQPASQVGGDERGQFEAWMHTFDLPPQLEGDVFNDENYMDADCFGQFVYDEHSTQRCWAAWQARAALAPAAVVIPLYDDPELHTPGSGNQAAAIGYNAALDEVARLNRNPIPVELLKRVMREWDQGSYDTMKPVFDELRAFLTQQEGGSHE